MTGEPSAGPGWSSTRTFRLASVRYGEPATPATATALVVAPSTTVQDAARRAMARPVASRFAPLVCTDAAGSLLGLVHVEDLVSQLAAR